MRDLAEVRINGEDYGDGRVVIEAKNWWNNGVLDWAVPAWEEMGLGPLEGPFPSHEAAVAALAVCAADLPLYGLAPMSRERMIEKIAGDTDLESEVRPA